MPLLDPGLLRIPPGAVQVCAGGETAVLRALGWNGRGRIRFSFRGCNDAAEPDRIRAALTDCP
jgi:hypothetical protein